MNALRSPLPALTAVLLLVATSMALSGCVFTCKTHLQEATWDQEGIPDTFSPRTVENHFYGDLGGGVRVVDGEVYVMVTDDQKVSQKDLQAFARDFFATKSWPEPTFEDAVYNAECADEI